MFLRLLREGFVPTPTDTWDSQGGRQRTTENLHLVFLLQEQVGTGNLHL